MNLIYEGKNILVKSAVKRADLILRSPFFQQQLIKNLDEKDAEKFQGIIDNINNSDFDDVYITTFWNPFNKEPIVLKLSEKGISLNLARIRKSKRLILQLIIKNFSKLHLNSNKTQVESINDHYLERQLRMITQAYT